ncbi:Hypothetical_protein [Hexamita inflata]|uniref:Hypothetical_protein n=1 Tax=Hexamita inflata TaxID=28002 RepID=A0AA86Q8I2_9EUKA|nr:Hypothetical protein HINF_LOCUS40196 [Hexamita inflata]
MNQLREQQHDSLNSNSTSKLIIFSLFNSLSFQRLLLSSIISSSKVCSFIQKKCLQKNESMLDSPVPLLGFALQLLLGCSYWAGRFYSLCFKKFYFNVTLIIIRTFREELLSKQANKLHQMKLEALKRHYEKKYLRSQPSRQCCK